MMLTMIRHFRDTKSKRKLIAIRNMHRVRWKMRWPNRFFSTLFAITPLHTRRISPTMCPARPTRSEIPVQGGPEEEENKSKTKDALVITMRH